MRDQRIKPTKKRLIHAAGQRSCSCCFCSPKKYNDGNAWASKSIAQRRAYLNAVEQGALNA